MFGIFKKKKIFKYKYKYKDRVKAFISFKNVMCVKDLMILGPTDAGFSYPCYYGQLENESIVLVNENNILELLDLKYAADYDRQGSIDNSNLDNMKPSKHETGVTQNKNDRIIPPAPKKRENYFENYNRIFVNDIKVNDAIRIAEDMVREWEKKSFNNIDS